jgi:hypothetical protein
VSSGNAHGRCAFAHPGVVERYAGRRAPTGRMVADAFYSAHGTLIVIAQAIGALALIPLAMFARALDRRERASDGAGRSRIVPAVVLVVVAEIVTNALPVVIVTVSSATAATMHTWTKVEDIADAILFVALAVFVVAVARSQVRWILAVGWASAALMLVHAVVSLFGASPLQAVAPLSFVAFVLVLSIRVLLQPVPQLKSEQRL